MHPPEHSCNPFSRSSSWFLARFAVSNEARRRAHTVFQLTRVLESENTTGKLENSLRSRNGVASTKSRVVSGTLLEKQLIFGCFGFVDGSGYRLA